MVVTKKAIDCEYQQSKIIKLLDSLWIKSNNIWIYIQAFIHKSIVNERTDYAPEHNERLEFLWDAVLELIITKRLYIDFPLKTEWELTDYRSTIVRWTNLANIATNLNFEEYLLLWKWEEKTWWRTNWYILANTLESFLWALYLDNWFEIVEEFAIKNIYSTLEEILKSSQIKDYKTLFQEFSQAEFEITPNYNLISDIWPDHNKNFEVGVYLWEKFVWVWFWSSKKKAQEKAAEDAFIKLSKKIWH